MRTFKALRGVLVATCLVAGFAAVVPGAAIASGLKVCVQEKEGGSIKLPKAGVCKPKYKLTELGEPSVLSKTEQEELKELRKYAKVIPSGVDGKPTVQVSGANVQIVNGEGKTESANGEGNLVLGYDENESGQCSNRHLRTKQQCEEHGETWTPEPHAQTGSHNLILGKEQTFTSFGGIDAGVLNTISGGWATITGGRQNTSSGEYSAILGGEEGTASGVLSSVSGGDANSALGFASSVSGGELNEASGPVSSVSGGRLDNADGFTGSWAAGGEFNVSEGRYSAVSGGYENNAAAAYSSIFGGKHLETKTEFEAIP